MPRRIRIRIAVGAIAVAAAALVVGVTVLQAEETEEREEPGRPPPLELGLLLRDDREAIALREAERTLERGNRARARARFEALARENPDSVEAAVGAAVAAWPEGTLARLRRLVAEHPASGVARLHLGFALLAAGDADAAVREWREVERRDPDSPSALRAEDVLHPQMAPGRPPFVAALPRPELEALRPERQLAELERRAEHGGADEWIVLGTAFQRVGRPVSARAAFERAADLAPGDVVAQVAAAVGRFDKDDPAQTFSRLGPLTRERPRAAVLRYHLGLCLSWLGSVEGARRQLRLAAEADRGGFYGREAERLLVRLAGVGT